MKKGAIKIDTQKEKEKLEQAFAKVEWKSKLFGLYWNRK